MIIDYQGKRIAFIHIGGNAGTSIEWYLWTLHNNVPFTDNLETEGDFKYIHTERNKDFLKSIRKAPGQHATWVEMCAQGHRADVVFSVVRNPYERMLAKFFASPHAENVTPENSQSLFESFVDECYAMETPFARDQARHTMDQTLMFAGCRDVEVLRFEHLDVQMRYFAIRHDLPRNDLRMCNSTFHPLKTMDIYTEKSRYMVREHNMNTIRLYYADL